MPNSKNGADKFTDAAVAIVSAPNQAVALKSFVASEMSAAHLALYDALLSTVTHLADVIGNYEIRVAHDKSEGVPDTMFTTRVADYKKQLEVSREALRKYHMGSTPGAPELTDF